MPRLAPAIGFCSIVLAILVVNAFPVLRPVLVGDDLEILVRSWTWERTRQTLWEPQNEHAMPLGRLSTRVLVLLAGRSTRLPLAASLQGPLAQLMAVYLLYLFVCRELADRRLALIAAAIFGVTSIYQQAVSWFAASFSLLALGTLLLALLAVQSWKSTRHWPWLALCVLASALAPAWFASGVLAGPLCSLYLLTRSLMLDKREESSPSWRSGRLAGNLLWTLTPLAGTLSFLIISLPRTAEYIMHLEHYSGRSATEAFDPLTGLWYTCRSLVDNLALGQLGISGVICPPWLVPAGLVLLAAAGGWWWKQAAHRGLLLLGLAFIFSNYLLVYSARAGWDYVEYNFASPSWDRYHLLPQLGLALFVVGGLQLQPAGAQEWTWKQRRRLHLILALLVLVSLPRAILPHLGRHYQEQHEVLQEIEAVDSRCRELRLDAATARAALGWKEVPEGSTKENGWDFLRGSDNPLPWSVEAARKALQDATEPDSP
jgi:hypothetical protein